MGSAGPPDHQTPAEAVIPRMYRESSTAEFLLESAEEGDGHRQVGLVATKWGQCRWS